MSLHDVAPVGKQVPYMTMQQVMQIKTKEDFTKAEILAKAPVQYMRASILIPPMFIGIIDTETDFILDIPCFYVDCINMLEDFMDGDTGHSIDIEMFPHSSNSSLNCTRRPRKKMIQHRVSSRLIKQPFL
jgi:hypothetical protein